MSRLVLGQKMPPPPIPLCVEMDFRRTFQASLKDQSRSNVQSNFHQGLVVLKYHIFEPISFTQIYVSKGQTISEGNCGVLNFSKKNDKFLP